MNRFVGKLCIGLAILSALYNAPLAPVMAECIIQQPPPQDPFNTPINTIRTYGNCFRCDGEETLINLILAAQAAHNAGDVATCRLRLQAAIMCANKPSREFVYVNPNDPSQLLPMTSGGKPIPISQYFSSLGSGPVTIYAIFSYQLPNAPFSLNLDRALDCNRTLHDLVITMLTTALGSC